MRNAMQDEVWRGIGKVIEECGEVGQLLGKLILYPDGNHPDGKGHLYERLGEEIADLYAALDYFVAENDMDIDGHISERRKSKFDLFNRWILSGLKQ